APSFEKTRDLVFGDRCKNHPVHRCGDTHLGEAFRSVKPFCCRKTKKVPGGVLGAPAPLLGALDGMS
ncbi:hypothetical protein Q5H91_15225, partial [Sphingomonas sp. KR1UV-12]